MFLLHAGLFGISEDIGIDPAQVQLVENYARKMNGDVLAASAIQTWKITTAATKPN
jgi:hypothetical protein